MKKKIKSSETQVEMINGQLNIINPFLEDLENTLFDRVFIDPCAVPRSQMPGIAVMVNEWDQVIVFPITYGTIQKTTLRIQCLRQKSDNKVVGRFLDVV